MTLRLKIELIVGAVLLLGALFGAKVWLDEHDSRIKAEASVAAQQQLQQQYQAQVSDLAKRMDARDQAYNTSVQSLARQYQSATTPQQVAELLSKAMGLREPVVISQPAPTPTNPNPQPTAQLSSSDFPTAKNYVQSCEQCKLDRAKLQADIADRESQASLAQLQIDSLKKENLSLTQAVKGGSFFSRLGKATKFLVVGAAGGVVAICATGHCK